MSNNGSAAARFIVLSYFDISTQDDGETEAHLADFCQRLACTIGTDFTKATQRSISAGSRTGNIW